MTAKPSGSSRDQDYRAAMRDEIAGQWVTVWKAMPKAVKGSSPDGVHQVRVASRRLRAAMDVATECFPPKWYRPLHKTAKSITKALGEVRDRDVLLQALAAERDLATEDERPGVDHLIAGVERDRKKARKAMIRFVTQLEKKGVRKETKRRFPRPRKSAKKRTADSKPATGQTPGIERDASLEANARLVLAERVAGLYGYAPIIDDADAVEALHEARIATKRLRYTLEIFSGVFGEEGTFAIDRLKDLQEELGVVHDHDVRIAMIEDELASLDDIAADDEPDTLRPGLEALLRRERASRATAHTAVVDRWQALEGEDLQARLTALSADPDPDPESGDQ